MAFDEHLAERMRAIIPGDPAHDEKKMFGGIAFFCHGNIACGVNRDNMIVRVGPDVYEAALAEDHVKEFDITGRPMTGWVEVAPPAFEDEMDLKAWIERGYAFARSLPPK